MPRAAAPLLGDAVKNHRQKGNGLQTFMRDEAIEPFSDNCESLTHICTRRKTADAGPETKESFV